MKQNVCKKIPNEVSKNAEYSKPRKSFDFFSLVNLNLMLTDTAAVAAENDDDTKQKKNV